MNIADLVSKKSKKIESVAKFKLFAAMPDGSQHQIAELLEDWKQYYQEYHNVLTSFDKLKIPKRPQGDYMLFVVAAGAEQIANACREKFRVIRDYDRPIERDAFSVRCNREGPYAVWIKRHDPSENSLSDHAGKTNKSARFDLTMTERLLYDHRYCLEIGEISGIFLNGLCPGTKLPNGRFPHLFYSDEALIIGSHHPHDAEWQLRGLDVVA